MTRSFTPVALALACGFTACAHSETQSSETTPQATTASKESKTMQAIRKRAAFDLGCPGDQIQVAEIEAGTFMHPATYGATCGDKRASYLERMGTIIKQ